jgi:hypothetical protein
VAFGVGWQRNANGKLEHEFFRQGFQPWPAAADETLALLLEGSGRLDAYACPNVLSKPERAKWTSVAQMTVHTDVDGGCLDVEKVRGIPGAFAIYSGTPGNGHVYVLLTRPVTHRQHEQLCRALKKYLGAKDSKISDNDVLRVPGTWNFKPTADDPQADPLPVTWAVRPNGVRADPEELAALLGVELTDEPVGDAPKAKSPNTSRAVRGKPPAGAAASYSVEPFEVFGYPDIRHAMAKVSRNRSGDTMHIVGECARAGLTKANATWAVMRRKDLADRLLYECKHDDIARCFDRALNDMKDRT